MSFISKADIGAVIYDEKIDIITRGDDSKVAKAIRAAIAQVRGYLSRYDYVTIFATTIEADREKYESLISLTVDIAKWHLIKICNAGVDLQLAKECYDDAINELGKIQQGKVIYSDWPVIEADTEINQGFAVSSNPKRQTYF
jgi:hypothetical protein